MGTQGEGGHVKAMERSPQRKPTVLTLALGLPAFRTVRKQISAV